MDRASREHQVLAQLMGCANLTQPADVLEGVARWVVDLEQENERLKALARDYLAHSDIKFESGYRQREALREAVED